MSAVSDRSARPENRRDTLLEAAAARFAERGYHATSVREIAADTGMLPGSVYYHFASKEALLVAVYEEGVRRIGAALDAAVAGAAGEPRAALRQACRAHLQTLLEQGNYARVTIRVLPQDVPGVRRRLVQLRDAYEARFRVLIDALALPAGLDRGHLRRLLLGGLNWAHTWYREGGDSPQAVADAMLACLPLQGPRS